MSSSSHMRDGCEHDLVFVYGSAEYAVNPMTTTPPIIPFVNPPALLPVDLSRGHGSEHPDIIIGRTYLACVAGRWDVGVFSRQWYGLNFGGFYPAGCQFDAPVDNHSEWMALFEFVDGFVEYVEKIVTLDDDGEEDTQTCHHKFPNDEFAREWWGRRRGLTPKVLRRSFYKVVSP